MRDPVFPTHWDLGDHIPDPSPLQTALQNLLEDAGVPPYLVELIDHVVGELEAQAATECPACLNRELDAATEAEARAQAEAEAWHQQQAEAEWHAAQSHGGPCHGGPCW